jgi:hypothetical protein
MNSKTSISKTKKMAFLQSGSEKSFSESSSQYSKRQTHDNKNLFNETRRLAGGFDSENID